MKKVSFIMLFISSLLVCLAFWDRASYAANLEDLKNAVVHIKAFSGAKELGEGAGIVVGKEDGSVFILTAYHVVEKSDKWEVRFKDRQWKVYDDGRLYDKYEDVNELDVAVLIIQIASEDTLYKNLPELTSGDPSKANEVISIGHPGGERWQIAYNRILDLSAAYDSRKLRIQRIAISHGTSGGPLCDDQLRLIGMITRMDSRSATATKINTLLELLQTHWGIPTNLVKTTQAKTVYPDSYIVTDRNDLKNIQKYTKINGNLTIEKTGLEKLDELANLREVHGDLNISWNHRLVSLYGLSNLERVNGSVRFFDNNALNDFSGLNKLKYIGGELHFRWEDMVSLDGFDNLREIGGPLIFHDNNAFRDLNGFNKLVSIGGDLVIQFNSKMNKLSGFRSLRNIGGQLIIQENELLPAYQAQMFKKTLSQRGWNGESTIQKNK